MAKKAPIVNVTDDAIERLARLPLKGDSLRGPNSDPGGSAPIYNAWLQPVGMPDGNQPPFHPRGMTKEMLVDAIHFDLDIPKYKIRKH